MPANTKPIFALSPETRLAAITGTTTDKSGATTANIVDLVTATTDGTKVTQIKYKHVVGATTATTNIHVTAQIGNF